ncbi:hypothetical protein OG462_40690 [Streptomyces sp. NBC_01077]|uniref:hypothetical protein n=1 Tax=Streptomyces sp. NBC_01077 TaxID=2903746 RepID=UPI00386F4622|nr:hypothetical protein OG462_40690 [Streptomyces sp. NBC_01077]
MTHASPARSTLRQILALLVTAALTLSLSVILSFTSEKRASASCVASGFGGTWRSSDDRLSRIDVWPGEDCNLYARAWSTCKADATRDCSWGNKKLQATPERNFRFFYYNWSNANEVLHLRLKDKTHMSVWDRTDYTSGRNVTITLLMVKDR